MQLLRVSLTGAICCPPVFCHLWQDMSILQSLQQTNPGGKWMGCSNAHKFLETIIGMFVFVVYVIKP